MPPPRPHAVAIRTDQVALGDLRQGLFERAPDELAAAKLKELLRTRPVIEIHCAGREVTTTIHARCRFEAGDQFVTPLTAQ